MATQNPGNPVNDKSGLSDMVMEKTIPARKSQRPNEGLAQIAAMARGTAAIGLMSVAGYLSRQPSASSTTDFAVTGTFEFFAEPIVAPRSASIGVGMQREVVDGREYVVRNVNQSVEHIRSWISAVGAAVAVEDLDGDGFTNDVCWVCPRINRVVITKVGGAGKPSSPRFLDPPLLTLYGGASPGPANTIAPMGTLIGDFNEDGRLDVLVYFWGRSPVLFLRNSTPWRERTDSANENFDCQELCPSPKRWFTNAATQCDLNGDGHIDLIFGNYFADGATVLDPHSTVPVEMQASMSHATNGGSKHFLLWDKQEAGQGRYFREAQVNLTKDGREIGATQKDEFLRGWTLAMAAANFDANPSDLPGVYLANDFGHDVLLLPENAGRSRETLCFRVVHGVRDWMTPKSKSLGNDSFKGMGACARDFDADGIPDICVSNIATKWALLESHFAFASACLGNLSKDLATTDVTEKNLRETINALRKAYYAKTRNARMPLRDVSTELGLAQSGWGWDIKTASFDNRRSLQWVRGQGFIHGHRLSRLSSAISNTERPKPLAAGRWSVLHELATANDAALRSPTNWFTCQPGDDLSGRDRLAFFVADKHGHYFDQNAEESSVRMVSSSLLNSEEASTEADPMGWPMIARGVAIADVDGNGLVDFLVATQGLHQPEVEHNREKRFEDSYCFINKLAPEFSGYCLELRLLLPVAGETIERTQEFVGPSSAVPARGRPAIGATATFLLRTGDGPEVFSDTVDGGNGHSGKNSFDLHFGLGADALVNQPLPVLIRWRDPAIPSEVQEEVFQLQPGRPGDPEARYRHTLLLKGNIVPRP